MELSFPAKEIAKFRCNIILLRPGNPLPLLSDRGQSSAVRRRAIRKMSGQGDISAVLRLITILTHRHGNCWRDRPIIRSSMAAPVYFFVNLRIIYDYSFI